MKTCKYHPLQAATHHCDNCSLETCDQCCNTPADGRELCFICNRPMESLGAAQSVQPFWRRLDKIYSYAFGLPALGVILMTSLISMAQSVVLLLIATVFLTRYYFCCLEQTAQGELRAPGFAECFSGGGMLLVRLFLVYVVAVGVVGGVFSVLGLTAAMIVVVLLVVALPAIYILLAIHETLFDALNPVRIVTLLRFTGLSYWLMLAFTFIMLGSVQLLGEFVGDANPTAVLLIQSCISSYYMITIFHMMGYVVFQNQEALGFYATDKTVVKKTRSELQVKQAGIEVLVKEGLYQRVLETYRLLLPQAPENLGLWTNCFRFLCAIKDRGALTKFMSGFFPLVMEHQGEPAVAQTYRTLVEVAPDYLPDKADLRIKLASTLYDADDNKAAVRLLRDFHKQFTDPAQIKSAYELMANALERIPALAAKAPQYRRFAERAVVQKPVEQKPVEQSTLTLQSQEPRPKTQPSSVSGEDFYDFSGRPGK